VGDEGGPARVSGRLEPVLAARFGEALSGAAVVWLRRSEAGTVVDAFWERPQVDDHDDVDEK
jgi:hypothetical protein